MTEKMLWQALAFESTFKKRLSKTWDFTYDLAVPSQYLLKYKQDTNHFQQSQELDKFYEKKITSFFRILLLSVDTFLLSPVIKVLELT